MWTCQHEFLSADLGQCTFPPGMLGVNEQRLKYVPVRRNTITLSANTHVIHTCIYLCPLYIHAIALRIEVNRLVVLSARSVILFCYQSEPTLWHTRYRFSRGSGCNVLLSAGAELFRAIHYMRVHVYMFKNTQTHSSSNPNNCWYRIE